MKIDYGYVDIHDNDLFTKLNSRDVLSRLRQGGYLGSSHHCDKKTGKVKVIVESGMEWNTPWVHVNIDDSRKCNELQMIERCFGFVPTRCLECWKVVIRPKTIVDLFKLYNLMVKANETEDMFCKCGVEIDRPFVHALYGGYIYNNSRKEGLERLKQWRKLLADHIPGTDAYLKRYCSEFELRHGPTKGYNQPKEAKHWEKLIDECVEIETKAGAMPHWIIDTVMAFWIKTAYRNGDSTVLGLNKEGHIYTQCQKYEEKDHA